MDTTLIEKLNLSIPTDDFKRISEYAKEGKTITKIQSENFHQYSYDVVYHTVMQSEQQSALGIKRTITNRLNDLPKATKQSEREELVAEIDALVNKLYDNYKSNFEKLRTIRDVLTVI